MFCTRDYNFLKYYAGGFKCNIIIIIRVMQIESRNVHSYNNVLYISMKSVGDDIVEKMRQTSE